MPYIIQSKRDVLDPAIEHLHNTLVDMELDDMLDNNMEGNLNYTITRLLMMVYGDATYTRYSHINDALGVLECVKQEFYRKVAAPYEDQKEFENGPVVRMLKPAEQVGEVTVTPEQEAAMAEMVKLSQEMGLYDTTDSSKT